MNTVTLKGEKIQTAGELPKIGAKAANFSLTNADLQDVNLESYAGHYLILNIFPSVDTPTCAMSARQFNEQASQIQNTKILCISMDLPFAQKRFCAAENIQHVISLSAFRHPEFGSSQGYGVMIESSPLKGLLSRAVVILDKEGNVIYTEQVGEITHEPNYQAALAVLKK